MSVFTSAVELILSALYFAAPMYAANMAPVLVAKLPVLNTPIDGGRLWRGKPILGSHKTWRGLVAGVLAAVLVAYSQRFWGEAVALIDYSARDIWLFGALMGFGALFGDAVKSFFKRRVNVPPGGAWPPFDQIDFVVGGLLFAWLYQPIPVATMLTLLLLTPIGHVLVNLLAFAAGLKNVPY